MTTEVATAPTPLELDRDRPSSSASTSGTTSAPKPSSLGATPSKASKVTLVSVNEESSSSPESGRNEPVPQIVVKKEPTSPEPPSRHRPPKLHLNKEADGNAGPRTAGGALTTMRDVGMACLSPGFATHDPTMREQLQRSISVREQQRSIIEQRLQRGVDPKSKDHPTEPATARDRGSASRRRPPSSLTIVPPPHRAFQNERVVQSAPLNQSFTGRHRPPPALHPPSQHTSQLQGNRLPPISDVFAADRLEPARRPMDGLSSARPYPPSARQPQPSPNSFASFSRRERRSPEEALASARNQDDVLPRIIHYPGHQPPTPPSPPLAPQRTPSKLGVNGAYDHPPHSAKRKRTHHDYEREDSFGPDSRDSPGSKRRKKEEFLSLCSRAWDLFHS